MACSMRPVFTLVVAAALAACGGSTDEPADAPAQAAGAADKHILAVAPAAFDGNGWYWNPAEGGTGFMIEAQGGRAFVGFFMYEEGSGNPVWYAATGDLQAGEAGGDYNFAGDLRAHHGGRSAMMASTTPSAGTWTSLGQVTLRFSAGRAVVHFPGGRRMDAQRYVIDGSGHDPAHPAPPKAHLPETGWYWNPAEGGRGYAIEVQNDRIFMAVFHYQPDGSPTWNVVQGDVSGGIASPGLELYTGGQTLSSAHRQALKDVPGRVSLSFRQPCAGQLQFAGGAALTIRRYVIDGSTQPAGTECRALASFADVPDIGPTAAAASAGEALFGRLDAAGDADAYRIGLVAGTTYTFDLLGASSGQGSLADPRLSLHDDASTLLALNDNRDGTTRDARLSFTAPSTGTYQLRVSSSDPTAAGGRFVLVASGLGPGIDAPAERALSDHEGRFTGVLRGPRPGALTLALSGTGTVAGTLWYRDAPALGMRVSGTVDADGMVTLTTDSVTCRGVIAPTGSWGGCGAAGMFSGSWVSVNDPGHPVEPLDRLTGSWSGVGTHPSFVAEGSALTVSIVGNELILETTGILEGHCIYRAALTPSRLGAEAGSYTCPKKGSSGSWQLVAMHRVDQADVHVELDRGAVPIRLYGLATSGAATAVPLRADIIDHVGIYSGVTTDSPAVPRPAWLQVGVEGDRRLVLMILLPGKDCTYSATLQPDRRSITDGSYFCSDNTTGTWTLLDMRSIGGNDLYVSIQTGNEVRRAYGMR